VTNDSQHVDAVGLSSAHDGDLPTRASSSSSNDSALAHPEQGWQPILSQFIAKWQREAVCYASGSPMASPVGDMNRASADVVNRMLRELAEISGPLPPPPSPRDAEKK